MLRRLFDLLRLLLPVVMFVQVARLPEYPGIYSLRDLYFALVFGFAFAWYADSIGHAVLFLTDPLFRWFARLRG